MNDGLQHCAIPSRQTLTRKRNNHPAVNLRSPTLIAHSCKGAVYYEWLELVEGAREMVFREWLHTLVSRNWHYTWCVSRKTNYTCPLLSIHNTFYPTCNRQKLFQQTLLWDESASTNQLISSVFMRANIQINMYKRYKSTVWRNNDSLQNSFQLQKNTTKESGFHFINRQMVHVQQQSSLKKHVVERKRRGEGLKKLLFFYTSSSHFRQTEENLEITKWPNGE